MKRNCLLAMTALALAACGGSGGDDGASSGSTPAPATASTEGLWTGTLRSSTTNAQHTVTLLTLSTGEMRMFWNNCVQFIATSTTSNAYYTGQGDAYAPDGSIAACPATTFPNASSLATLTLSGQVSTDASLIGTYTAGGDTGSYNLSYSSAYTRVGTLARLTGNYATSGAALTIDANGNVTGTMGTAILTGAITTIDTTKNAYRISLLDTTTVPSSSTTSTSGTSSTTTTSATTTTASLSGVATLVDSGSGTDDNLLVSVSNTTTGFMMSLDRQ